MAYYLKRKESVSKAVRRLGRERIEHAVECLKASDRADAIHCARKDIKKLRAVLRMVRAEIAQKEFRQLTGTLREAAAHLAAPRDAHIKMQTLQSLAQHFKGQLAPEAWRHLRAELRKGSDEQLKRFAKEKTANTVARILRRVAKRVNGLNVKEKEWKAIGPGVKNTYREGRRAYQTVVKDPSPENFHEWRKRVKDLWYHMRLLQPVWPEQMDAIAGELDALGNNLGDDHDLVVLKQDVAERFTGRVDALELETLKGLIEERQRELRDAALALGVRFYAEKPSAFCDRLGGYWKTWRREKKTITQVASA
jgi:CHAD domain-containing protein